MNQTAKNIGRLPPWIRVRWSLPGRHTRTEALLGENALNTVCESAQCPNRHECFASGTATVMILGNVCTRNCRFCAVPSGKPSPPDPDEPERVARFAVQAGLRHVVVTSVTRDDLPDGGASAFAQTIRALKRALPCAVETLVPDFQANPESLRTVLDAGPDVFNHNIETVRRLQREIRPEADYERSLLVLKTAAAYKPAPMVKSGIMVGLGETDAEIYEALRDLRAAGCVSLTIGQYLAPSKAHHPVARFVPPDMFALYREKAFELGFKRAICEPLARSSYKAGE